MKYAPIVLFAYNRPLHLAHLLASLDSNIESRDSVLYIYCDAPRLNASLDVVQKIEQVQQLAKHEKRFKKVFVIIREKNWGLAPSVIDGVTSVINEHGSAIILEDDLVVSKYFLTYMNDSLDRYKHNERVGQIGACNFFACGKKYPKAFFLPIPDSLGWGTWSDRWKYFNPDAQELFDLIKQDSTIRHKFNAYGAYNFENMLVNQINGLVSSWAVRWQAVCVLNNWLTLYPNPSLTNHIASREATHADFNIMPPLAQERPIFETVEAVEISNVVKAMKLGHGGIGDYYGNRGYYRLLKKIANRFFGSKIVTNIKKIVSA